MRRVEIPAAAGRRFVAEVGGEPTAPYAFARKLAGFAFVLAMALHAASMDGSFPRPSDWRGASVSREPPSNNTAEAQAERTMRAARMMSAGVAVSAVIQTASGADLVVPSKQFPTIQAAIDGAVNGDVVLVNPGLYIESCDLKGKAISVRPNGPPLSVTIQAPVDSRAIVCSQGETSATVIRGLRFAGYSANGLAGGGVRIVACSPTITECAFSGVAFAESAAGLSGALAIQGGTASVVDCIFEHCGAAGGVDGAAVVVFGNGASPTFTACVFRDNSPLVQGADFVSVGVNSSPGRATLIGCDFTGVSGGGFGARLYNYGQGGAGFTLRLTDCRFTAIDQQSVSLVHGWDSLQLERVTFERCHGPDALITHFRSAMTVVDCTLASNSFHTLFSVGGQGGTGVIRNTLFCGNAPVGPAFGSTLADGGGNIITSTCTPPCPTDLVHDGATNGADMAVLLNFWGTNGSQYPGVDLNNDGIVNGTDLAMLLNAWGPCPQ